MLEDVCAKKYEPVFKAELFVHKYFLGVPNNRLESYQRLFEIPLPDSTQFDKIEDVGLDVTCNDNQNFLTTTAADVITILILSNLNRH